MAQRHCDPASKYQQSGQALQRASFGGDNRDARSFAYWCHLWLSESYRVLREGGYCLVLPIGGSSRT